MKEIVLPVKEIPWLVIETFSGKFHYPKSHSMEDFGNA